MTLQERITNAVKWAETLRCSGGTAKTIYTDHLIMAVATKDGVTVTINGKSIIETYFDEYEMIGDSKGCYIARLRDNPCVWEAGINIEHTVRELVHSAMIAGFRETNVEDYVILAIPAPDNPAARLAHYEELKGKIQQ